MFLRIEKLRIRKSYLTTPSFWGVIELFPKNRSCITVISIDSVTLRVVAGKSGINEFIDVQWQIYQSLPKSEWIPPLRMSVYENLDTVKNPFYQRASYQLFIAEQNGKPVGRIAAIENRGHNEFHQDHTGFFGFFECINDSYVSNALFTAAEKWLKDRGLTSMMGPMNPSTNHECGLLIDGFEHPPTIMTTWNPDYYQNLLQQFSLEKEKDLRAYWIANEKISSLPERVKLFIDRLRKKITYQFRDFSSNDFTGEVDRC